MSFYENSVVKWVEHRLPIFSFVDHHLGTGYPAPKNLNYWYNFGSLAGIVAYVLGLLIYPWSAITESPLGRNHIMLATWTLSYWIVIGVIGYRFRRHLYEGAQRWITFALATIGAVVVTITGTLGGSLTGTPSLVTKSLEVIGWNVYMTFYLPTWMLILYGTGAVLLVAIGLYGRRSGV